MGKNVSIYIKKLNKKSSKKHSVSREFTFTSTMKLQQIFLFNCGEKISKHTHYSYEINRLMKYYHLMEICVYASLALTIQVRNYLHDR